MESKDEHIFLGYSILWNQILGVTLIKTKYPLLNILHRVYSYTWVLSGILIIASYCYEFYLLVHLTDMQKVTDNFRIGTLLLFGFLKYNFVGKKSMDVIIERVRQTERTILNRNIKDIETIYWNHHRANRLISKGFLIFGYWTLVSFFVYPVYSVMTTPTEDLTKIVDNRTVYVDRPFPFSGDFPFDKNKYFYPVVLFQMWSGWFTCSFTIIPDIFYWALMIFATAQVKVLQYRLKHFKELAMMQFMEEEGLDINDETLRNNENNGAIMKYLQGCIEEHRNIICYIEMLDGELKFIMLIFSLLAALQIAFIGLAVIMCGTSARLFDSVQYFSWTISQFFLFYYCANEILLAGLDIPSAIWESDWYTCTEEVKKTLLFILKRSQIPLVLNVGPFYQMSMITMLRIFKTAVSYFALMRQMYT